MAKCPLDRKKMSKIGNKQKQPRKGEKFGKRAKIFFKKILSYSVLLADRAGYATDY